MDVALATTATPTFFPAHRRLRRPIYIDGGLWANNPVGNAVVEALSWLDKRPADLQVLSIGCTRVSGFFLQFEGRQGLGPTGN